MTAVFFDTNVLLYLISEDPDKATIAERLLRVGGHVSVQNLAELTAVCRRKYRMAWDDIDAVRQLIQEQCKVHGLTRAVHNKAFELADATGYTIYDAQILAAAAAAGCDTVWSEDMHDGHDLTSLGVSLVIRNPFAAD